MDPRDQQAQDPVSRQCVIEEDMIVFTSPARYEIRLDRCATAEQILSWVNHLAEKSWVTTPLLRRFIHLACLHAGIAFRDLG
jgi:hypothetical protein